MSGPEKMREGKGYNKRFGVRAGVSTKSKRPISIRDTNGERRPSNIFWTTFKPSSHIAADLILFSLPRNLKRSGIQICLLMLIFGLSFPPFVNGDQRGRRRQEREGDVRPRPTACLVPKTCRHPLLSARLRKGKMDMDRKNVH